MWWQPARKNSVLSFSSEFLFRKNGVDAKIFHFHKTMLPFDKNSPKEKLIGHCLVMYFRIPIWIRCKNWGNIGFAKINVGFGFEMTTLDLSGDDPLVCKWKSGWRWTWLGVPTAGHWICCCVSGKKTPPPLQYSTVKRKLTLLNLLKHCKAICMSMSNSQGEPFPSLFNAKSLKGLKIFGHWT